MRGRRPRGPGSGFLARISAPVLILHLILAPGTVSGKAPGTVSGQAPGTVSGQSPGTGGGQAHGTWGGQAQGTWGGQAQGTWGGQSPGQGEVRTRPDTVYLGQPFRLEIRVRTMTGALLELPDTLSGLRDFHALGPVEVDQPTEEGDSLHWKLSYPLMALKSGFLPLPALLLPYGDSATARESAGRALRVVPGGVMVRSVLPHPASALSPAPPLLPEHGGASFPFAGILALAAALASGSAWHLTRKGPREWKGGRNLAPEPTVASGEAPPLERLRELMSRTPVSRMEAAQLFESAIPLVRAILEIRTSRNLEGRTTSEWVEVMLEEPGSRARMALQGALRRSERARFGPHPPTVEDVEAFVEGLETWLGTGGRSDVAAGAGGRHA